MLKLSNISDIIMGQSPPGNSYHNNEEGYPLLNGAADYKGQKFHPQKYTSSPTKLTQPGDILMGIRATIGNFAISNDVYCIGRGVAAIRVKENLAINKYVLLAIKKRLNDFLRISAGSTIKGIKKEDLTEMMIRLPSIQEQRQIVEAIDHADMLREKRKQVIDLLDEYLKSVFLDMFGDPISNPKNWQKKPLRKFGQVITGNTPSRNNESNYSSDFIEWIKTDNIEEKDTYLTKATEYLSEHGLSKGRSVEKGAVLMACIAGSINSIGRVAIANRKVAFNQQINAIQPNGDINNVFLYFLLSVCRKYIQDHATKGMKRIITKGEFEKISMISPPFEIQEKFSKKFIQIETLKQQMLNQSEQLDIQFNAIMQKAFSY